MNQSNPDQDLLMIKQASGKVFVAAAVVAFVWEALRSTMELLFG
jgi:hypothetical protein